MSSASNLKVLSLKNNKKISDIGFVKDFSDLKSLDVSNTLISDISPISELNQLESVYLNDNKITSLEALKNMNNIINLDVSNIDVTFDEVRELNSFNNLVSLGLDGFSDVDISAISNVTSLTKLSISNCDLANKDLSGLNNLSNLRELDISFNGYDNSNFNLSLQADNLIYLKTLRIGGNNFTSLPVLTDLVSVVNVLDLSHSYYLEDVSDIIEYWNLGELILDYCNKLDFGEGTILLMDMIAETICRKISIVGSLMSFDQDQFEFITSKEYLSVRLIGDEYHNCNDEGLLRGYYTSLLDYASTLEKDYNNRYIVEQIKDTRDIVLYLTDNDEEITEHYTFYVPRNINSITVYGRNTYDLKISFVTTGEFTLYLADIVSVSDDYFLQGNDVNIISIYESSGVQGAKGEVDFTKHIAGSPAIKGTNVYLTAYGDASLRITGGKGDRGVTGDSGDYKADHSIKRGGDGSNGGAGIICSNLVIDSPNITIKGGSGGYGGQGGAGVKGSLFSNYKYGGNGGTGGNGGIGVIYIYTLKNDKNAVIEGGTAGGGGLAGPGVIGTYDGEVGSPGEDGLSSNK